MNNERNCQFCNNYKDDYCSELDMKPCYPEQGCDYFSERNKLKEDTMQILDKIRAEIEHMIPCSKETLSMKLGVLEIIDKYTEESEG